VKPVLGATVATVTVTLREQSLAIRTAALRDAVITAVLGDGVEAALMQKVLETHVRAQLDSLAEIRTGLG